MFELKKDRVVVVSFTVLAMGLGALCGFGVITWPQLLAGLGVLAAPSIFGRKAADEDPPPGPPPLLVLLLVGTATFPMACASGQEKAREAELSYAAAQAKCSSTEATREAVDACRARVREQWSVAPRTADGGR